jgi:hypothetical protein
MMEDDDEDDRLVSLVVVEKMSLPIDDRYCVLAVVLVEEETRAASALFHRH